VVVSFYSLNFVKNIKLVMSVSCEANVPAWLERKKKTNKEKRMF
jgi:hypothetical protein